MDRAIRVLERAREGWREPVSTREGQGKLERAREGYRGQGKVNESQTVFERATEC